MLIFNIKNIFLALLLTFDTCSSIIGLDVDAVNNGRPLLQAFDPIGLGGKVVDNDGVVQQAFGQIGLDGDVVMPAFGQIGLDVELLPHTTAIFPVGIAVDGSLGYTLEDLDNVVMNTSWRNITCRTRSLVDDGCRNACYVWNGAPLPHNPDDDPTTISFCPIGAALHKQTAVFVSTGADARLWQFLSLDLRTASVLQCTEDLVRIKIAFAQGARVYNRVYNRGIWGQMKSTRGLEFICPLRQHQYCCEII